MGMKNGGYLGRVPGDDSVIIARQPHSPTGVQTDFTLAAGYNVGYIDAYLNGAILGGTNLHGAYLGGAKLSNLDLSEAR